MTIPQAQRQHKRLPLRRPVAGRWVAGVAQGLAAHLNVDVRYLRLGFVIATLGLGAGAVLYAWLWIFVPQGDPAVVAREQRPAAGMRLAPRLQRVVATVSLSDIIVGLLLLLAAGMLVLWRWGIEAPNAWLLPVLVVLGGVALVWSQIDAGLAGGARRGRWLRAVPAVGGMLLVLLGALLLVGRDRGIGELVTGLAAGVAVLVGGAVVSAPVWVRLVRDLGAERTARAREAERADMAAHLHDSVLQTLSLIRSRADDAVEVARLARAQERDLRRWLYEDRPQAGTSLVEDMREVAAEVEDRFGVAVDVVTAGDVHPARVTNALVGATREALHNAVVHGAAPVSMYVEVGPQRVEVFVRDRGAGFDVRAVPADRHGVR
ncbi:MAG TPA: PspC domain-containing protein, partial [Actinomycetaceae bacterium]|nr:PspC domain-containing protein [Actinomycetaceae bacterium]